MSSLVIALWFSNIALDTVGQLAFKAAAGDQRAGDGLARWRYMATHPWLWVGISCYLFEFLVWVAFVSLLPLSEGILLGSINIVAIMLAGRWLFAEKLTRLRLLGMFLVALGVVVVGAGA